MEYSKKYGEIKAEAVHEVRNLIKARFFKKSENEKKDIILNLHKNLCKVYGLSCIPVLYAECEHNNGCFTIIPSPQIIIYGKCSLIIYLHEFKHYLDFSQNIPFNKISDMKARGWSLSFFYLAAPGIFKRSVKKGFITIQKIK